LQGWFDYLLTPDNWQQKITMMVGRKQSIRPRTPLDPGQEPVDREPMTKATASSLPPF